jgi:hypothetical protein
MRRSCCWRCPEVSAASLHSLNWLRRPERPAMPQHAGREPAAGARRRCWCEDDHRRPWPKRGGARMGSRAGRSRSTPPTGATRPRMAAARLRGGGAALTTCRRISRASSSIERPCSAARTRRRRLRSSSRLRIVMLAIAAIKPSLGAARIGDRPAGARRRSPFAHSGFPASPPGAGASRAPPD